MVKTQISTDFTYKKTYLFHRLSQIRQGWKDLAIPVFIFTLLVLIFFWGEIFGRQLFVHRDLGRYFYPLREYSAKRIAQGHIPLWNPYISCGNPHLAELQTCVFYPLSLIYYLLPFPISFNLFIVLHILLAGIFMNLLMRQWGYSKTAGIFSGIVFMFSGYMVSVINLLASLASVIWFPLVLFFYERYLRLKRFKDLIFLSLSLSFMFLGGEPTIVYITILILFFMSIFSGGIKGLLIGFLLFLGLSSFQIFPFLEFIFQSNRLNLDYAEATMWSLPIYALLDFFIPFLSETDYIYKDYWMRQSWLLIYYMGISAILFSSIAFFFNNDKKRKFLFFLLIAGLTLSLGRYFPLYGLLYKFLPGFSLTRYPIKFFFLIAFSIAGLAGIGLDCYRKDLNLERFAKFLLCLGLVSSFLYLLLELNFNEILNFLKWKIPEIRFDSTSGFLSVNLFNLKRQLIYFCLVSVLFFLGLKKKKGILFNLFIFISAIDLFTANKNIYINQETFEFLRATPNIEFIKSQKGYFRIFASPAGSFQNTFVPEKDYLLGLENLKERFVSNRMMGFELYDANGYGSIYRKRHLELIDLIMKQRLPNETNLLNLLNVKYIISPKIFEVDGFKLVKKGEVANIYENLNYLPRAFLAEEAVVIKEEGEILKELASKEFDPQKKVILEEDFPPSTFHLPPSTFEYANIIQYEPEIVSIEANVNSPKFLILSDTYYPGWKAYIDEKEVHIYRVDYILRAIYLNEPGTHKIRFIYESFSFKIGMFITLVTIVVILCLFFERSENSKRNERSREACPEHSRRVLDSQ